MVLIKRVLSNEIHSVKLTGILYPFIAKLANILSLSYKLPNACTTGSQACIKFLTEFYFVIDTCTSDLICHFYYNRLGSKTFLQAIQYKYIAFKLRGLLFCVITLCNLWGGVVFCFNNSNNEGKGGVIYHNVSTSVHANQHNGNFTQLLETVKLNLYVRR